MPVHAAMWEGGCRHVLQGTQVQVPSITSVSASIIAVSLPMLLGSSALIAAVLAAWWLAASLIPVSLLSSPCWPSSYKENQFEKPSLDCVPVAWGKSYVSTLMPHTSFIAPISPACYSSTVPAKVCSYSTLDKVFEFVTERKIYLCNLDQKQHKQAKRGEKQEGNNFSQSETRSHATMLLSRHRSVAEARTRIDHVLR